MHRLHPASISTSEVGALCVDGNTTHVSISACKVGKHGVEGNTTHGPISTCNLGKPDVDYSSNVGTSQFSDSFDLRAVTANVNTLADKPGYKRGDQVRGRAQLLEMAFDNEGIVVAGIQESRAQIDQTIAGTIYDMFAAGADETGNYGTQIWVKRGGPVKQESFMPRSPRLVEISASVNGVQAKVHFFAAHAPHSGDRAEAKATFWELLLKHVLDALRANRHVVMMIDANARIGSCSSPYIGKCSADRENNNGMLFRDFLEHTGLSATSTFFDGGWTWQSSKATRHHIDYIVTDTLFHSLAEKSYPLIDVELSRTSKDDHRAMALSMRIIFDDSVEQ